MTDDKKETAGKKIEFEDTDWKAQAQREKAALEKEAETNPAGSEELPPANFTTHISSLGTQAFIFLGLVKNPLTNDVTIDLDQAKYSVDTLQMLKDKTKGNLAKDEEKLLDALLFELRMKFVSVSEEMNAR
jgi:hypothetical protein